jgi:hypothetical protein
MPPLSELLKTQSMAGFSAIENPPTITPPPPGPQGAMLGINPYLRCPLPPFSATTDTLRQFNESGIVPARRVIPLPISASTGNSTSVSEVTETSGSSTSGGGSSTTPTSSLTASSVTLNIPSLGAGASFVSNVKLAQSYQLLQVTSTQPIEFRLYGTNAAQVADQTRSTDSPVPFEVYSGLATDIVFDTAPYVWSWQNRIGANSDSPQTTNGYVTIINPSSGNLSAGTVTIRFLALET